MLPPNLLVSADYLNIRHPIMRHLLSMLALIVAASGHADLHWQCGQLKNGYGPFDYTNSVHVRDKLPVVERVHFDSGIEHLTSERGITGSLSGDINYTLRAFPNHHRALYTVVKYHTDLEASKRKRLEYSADCYFLRAIEFKSDDPAVRLIYGIYLAKIGNSDAAIQQLNEAHRLAPGSAEIHYNLGLTLLSMGKVDAAARHAHDAYALGYPLPGLRRKLEAVGFW